MSTSPLDLQRLPPELATALRRFAFDPEQLAAWSRALAEAPAAAKDAENRVTGEVTAPLPGDVTDVPSAASPEGEALAREGREAMAQGKLALVVLAGGMATRMGGVVKALVPAVGDRTFLDLRLGEHEQWSRVSRLPVPLWLMTSFATDEPMRAALASRGKTPEGGVTTFVQQAALRLASDGSLFLGDDGAPSVYATGHGDLPDALGRASLLARFIARGGRYLLIANLDNIGASIDPVLLGWHMRHGNAVTVEVVDKVGSDRGGIPVRHRGRPVILEEPRLPLGFDARSVPVFNTNTFWVDAVALSKLALDWTYIRVEKKVGARAAIQFERLIGEICVALSTSFARVPREGIVSRFMPVKDPDELTQRRAEIEAIARARGMLR